jgi:glycosyltransferase involved in cell wall biosynthesis
MHDFTFFGPIAPSGGPAIRNRLTINYLSTKKGLNFLINNTHSKNVFIRLKNLFSFLFARGTIIISTSQKGRASFSRVAIIKRLFDKKTKIIVFSIGGTIVDEYDKDKVFRNFLKSCVAVFSQTTRMHNDLLERGINSFYFPNFKVETSESNGTKSEFIKPFKLVFLSSIRNKKGIVELIEAVSRFEPEDVSLDIFGPIRKDFDADILEELPNNIQYKGFIEKENVTKTLSKYDIFVFPTRYEKEGFPTVILDAYSAGLPVISSNINFNPDIVKDGYNGFIYDPYSKDALYLTLVKAFSNPKHLETLSMNNLHEIKKYNIDLVLNNVYDNLMSLVGKKQ